MDQYREYAIEIPNTFIKRNPIAYALSDYWVTYNTLPDTGERQCRVAYGALINGRILSYATGYGIGDYAWFDAFIDLQNNMKYFLK